MKIDLASLFNDYYISLVSMAPKIVTALIAMVLFIILGKLAYQVVGKRIQRRWKDNIVSSFIAQAIKWSLYLFGMIIGFNILGFGGIAGSLLAGAGVSAIIFGFAFKDIGENLLAGVILALKRPFEIGDIIEIEGFKGTVKDLDMRNTHLRNVEGKDIYIPNSSIIKNTLINYTKDGLLRINFMIGIAPENDIDVTRKLISDYLKQNNQVLQSPAPNVVVMELGEFTTDLQVLFWVNILVNKNLPDSFLGHTIRSKVITDVKTLLDSNHIEMPSQVLEHKMYRDQKIKVDKSE